MSHTISAIHKWAQSTNVEGEKQVNTGKEEKAFATTEFW